MSLNRKFNEDSKNGLKTVIFLTPNGFYKRFCPWLSFQTVFLAIQILTAFFSLTVLDFALYFMSLDKKFKDDSKNVLKTVIFLLQVGFTGDFVSDCPFKLCC